MARVSCFMAFIKIVNKQKIVLQIREDLPNSIARLSQDINHFYKINYLNEA